MKTKIKILKNKNSLFLKNNIEKKKKIEKKKLKIIIYIKIKN